jgi:hypothetical protein
MRAEFAAMDLALMRRLSESTVAVRKLRYSYSAGFKRSFAEGLLPLLCSRLDVARKRAESNDLRGAGIAYQGLLVASQVLQLDVALFQLAELADEAGQPGGQIDRILAAAMQPLSPALEAALSDDPDRLARELPDAAEHYNLVVTELDRWATRLNLGAERLEIARTLWDTLLASIVAVQVARVLAVAVTRAVPPSAVVALAGTGGARLVVDRVALTTAAEAIRKLIMLGAIDAPIVAGIQLMGHETPERPSIPPPQGSLSTTAGTTQVRPKLGGAYKDVVAPGSEAHHMPGRKVSPLPVAEGPAIRMDPPDHWETASYGRGPGPDAYRARQRALIQEGKFREAQQMDIDDVRSKFGTKYDPAIKEMLEYTDTIDPSKLWPKGPVGGGP